MVYLGAAIFDQVRSLIDQELTDADLPDAQIGQAVYLDAAEDWLADRIPATASITPENHTRIVRAGIRYLAALLAPSVPNVVRVGDREAHEWKSPVNRAQQARSLLTLATDDIAQVLANLADTDTTATIPNQFIVAPGARGR